MEHPRTQGQITKGMRPWGCPFHPDPANCFLAATVRVLELTLVTADSVLMWLGEVATLGNR